MPEKLSIEEFDKLAREKRFRDGPYIDTFGDGYGEYYVPVRRVWGTLDDGREVEGEIAL